MNPSIYIIGAQCTGKSTLVNALHNHFAGSNPSLWVLIISELARGVLQRHRVTGQDVQAGSSAAMHLQRVILGTQFEAERSLLAHDMMISDRSGLDPIAYAQKYGGSLYAQALMRTEEWTHLQSCMQQSVVVLCEPVMTWLIDDGERLMPKTCQEWFDLHRVFLNLLKAMSINFTLLSARLTTLEDRVNLVLSNWQMIKLGVESSLK